MVSLCGTIYIVVGGGRVRFEDATPEQLRSCDRVRVSKGGEEVLTQAQMAANELVLCVKYGLPFPKGER